MKKTAFQANVSDREWLRRSLLPLRKNCDLEDCDTEANRVRGFACDSLVKVILRSCGDAFQADAISTLLEQLPLSDDREEQQSRREGQQKLISEDVPRLILRQLCWLEYVADGGSLLEKLLECIPVCDKDMQNEAIVLLPDIVGDAEHQSVAEALRDLMESDQSLTASVLDALSNLNLDRATMESVTDSVVTLLESAKISDLPVVVRFLVQRATVEKLPVIVDSLRRELSVSFETAASSTVGGDHLMGDASIGGPRSALQHDGESLALDAVLAGLRHRAEFAECFLRTIKSASTSSSCSSSDVASQHCIVDVWILVCMYSWPQHRKKIEGMWKKKVSAGVFSPDLISRSICGHRAALLSHYPSLLALTSVCVRCRLKREALNSNLGVAMYCALFDEFEDNYSRQEVVGSLITHTGSGNADEVNRALGALTELVDDDERRRGLKPFEAFFMGFLDYIEKMTAEQTRSVFHVLCSLAYEGGSCARDTETNPELDNIQIVLRKYLCGGNPRLKHYGIIGVVSLVEVIGCDNASAVCRGKSNSDSQRTTSSAGDAENDDAEFTLCTQESPPNLLQCRDLIKMALDACHGDFLATLPFLSVDTVSLCFTSQCSNYLIMRPFDILRTRATCALLYASGILRTRAACALLYAHRGVILISTRERRPPERANFLKNCPLISCILAPH